MPKLKRTRLLQLLHRRMVLPAFSKRVSTLPHRAVHLVDAVDRDARREDHVALVAELHDLRQHRDGAVMRDAGRVERELAQLRELVDHHPRDLDQVVAGGRLAAGDRGVLDVLPEVGAERLLDLGQRHVFLAIAARPVAAHFATGVAHERAMEDEDGRLDGGKTGYGAVEQVTGRAERSLRKVFQRIDLGHSDKLYCVSPGT